MSGSMQGAGSVEESRLFSFDRSSICCSPTPMLFTDSCHYLRLIRFHPICQSTLFTETWTNQTFNREVSQRGLSVSACVFFDSAFAETNQKIYFGLTNAKNG